MPFIQTTIQPKHLSQKSLFDENGRSLVNDYELEAVTNNTLCNVLRQLASLVLAANDIFEDLAKQLQDVHERSTKLQASMHLLEVKIAGCDPKTVTVPESDICTFSLRTIHFKSEQPVTTNLFTVATRPKCVQKIYDSAVPTPVHTIRDLDRFRRDGSRSSKFFVCTPVLGGRRKRYKKVDLEIETRKPVAVEDLRRWTSAEAMGDMTVLPNNTSKITSSTVTWNGENADEVDHLLPSPEEQMMALAQRFPPSIVAVDISGKPFQRMSGLRRSLINVELTSDGAGSRRKVRSRRSREKRRNTIAGTSQKEIQQAIAGETTTETEGCEFEPLSPLRSKSSDLFKLNKTSHADNIRNHFNTLKNWSKTKLRLINRNSSSDSCKPSFQGSDIVDDLDIYETITTVKRRREKERKPSTSSSAISIPASSSSTATSLAVKLRENSLQRRHRRKGTNKGQDEPVHSSSGNWSASSESGRTSIASETTAPPKSSTTTSSNSLNHHHHPPPSVQSRRRYLNASTSSSVSEGTITPDINDMQYHDFDGETSSVYSCDTEGYYTSFHLDSGLKTLKEEEIALSFSTLHIHDAPGPTTTTFNNSSGSGSSSTRTSQLTAENEYELFGKGSTSTTTSSAGTVCTTLLANGHGYGSTRSLSQFAPAVPERKSSLDRKEKKQKEKCSDSEEMEMITDRQKYSSTMVDLIHDSPSPDSGHNTSSSPAGSTSQNSQSPNEHLEFSESDLEGCERVERIRSKTAITTCRIPSMCVITPPQSDDEVSLRNYSQVPFGVKFVPLNQYESVVANGIPKTNSTNGSKPLQIQIPEVPEFKKGLTDIYALPDKSKKTKVTNFKTVSTNGVLETNLDSVPDDSKNALHLVVNRESGYATIKKEANKGFRSPSPSGGTVTVNERKEEAKPSQPVLKSSLLPMNFMDKFKEVVNKQKKTEKKSEEGDYVTIVEKSPKTDEKHSTTERKSEYVSLDDLPTKKTGTESALANSSAENSLERKKRSGARVTLDSEGKVVYSSDSLKRRKQHSTFIPGKFVRESPTPSPIMDHRVPKQIRPVPCSGLVRTNSDDRKPDQVGKIIIKAGARSCDSPTKDFVRIPPTRVVSPTGTPKKNDRGARIVFENGMIKNRSASPASSSDASSLERKKRVVERCVSPSSSSSSSNETKKTESEANSEEGKIINEVELDKLGDNLDTDFSKRIDEFKLEVALPEIFKIEPEVPAKRAVKRSDSYRMANSPLSVMCDFTKLPSVAESEEVRVTRCKVPLGDPNYKILMEGLYSNPPKWISMHPAVIQQRESHFSPSGFPRNHPMYWTLPSRKTYSNEECNNGERRSSSKSNYGRLLPSNQDRVNTPNVSPYKNIPTSCSSQQNGATTFGSPKRSAEFLSSTPTKTDRPTTVNLVNGMSPILKDGFLSPRTTMTSEEIFTAIHKSKKKLSMKDADGRGESPTSPSPEALLPEKSRDRSSWSPNSCEALDVNRNEPRTRKSWNGAGTSINTFKKLLLQHGTKSGSKDSRMSAVEQLKLSKSNANSPPRQEPTKTSRSILSGRGRVQWRFASPRTDILSSTIPEDCSEVEKSDEAKNDASSPKIFRQGGGSPNVAPVGEEANRRSLETTRKSLEEARKNFFNGGKPIAHNGSGFRQPFSPQTKTCGMMDRLSPSNNSKLAQDKRKASIISLETAL